MPFWVGTRFGPGQIGPFLPLRKLPCAAEQRPQSGRTFVGGCETIEVAASNLRHAQVDSNAVQKFNVGLFKQKLFRFFGR